jgi:LacI family transcriptional regulator
MATLKDVARLACVDVSTASRALNNTSYVHPETKARIYAAVKQLSYHPNLLAKGLRQGKRHTIGVVVPSISMSVFSEITQGIELEARKFGYETLICCTKDDPNVERECLNRLRNGFGDGIIIASTGENARLIRDIRDSGISVVQVVRRQDKSMSSVVTDYHEIAYNGVKYLVSKGCHHIGLINGFSKLIPYRDRYRGYHDAMEEFGLTENVVGLTGPSRDYFKEGFEGVYQLLKQDPQLDGIMAAVDMHGIGALRALKKEGVKFPEQIKVMSLTGHCIGDMLETPMTSMEMPAMQMGSKAVSLLIGEMKTQQEIAPAYQHIMFHASLAERETT